MPGEKFPLCTQKIGKEGEKGHIKPSGFKKHGWKITSGLYTVHCYKVASVNSVFFSHLLILG